MNIQEIKDNIEKREKIYRFYYESEGEMSFFEEAFESLIGLSTGSVQEYVEETVNGGGIEEIEFNPPDVQYIGLAEYTEINDNENKEIYHGDILRGDSDENNGVVIKEDGRWIVDFGLYWVKLSEYIKNEESRKITGNVFQNPELLTPAK